MLKKIISGAQTGVDRAALDVAIQLNISYGGWCPKARIDEQGTIPAKYDVLQEISGEFANETENYATRTKYNIRDSDGTLILVPITSFTISDGTAFTIEEVQKQKKPFLILDLSASESKNISIIITWLEKNNIKILNIAGPRESKYPGIYKLSCEFLEKMLFYLCKNNQ